MGTILAGKSVLITGAGTGIGAAVAVLLGAQGSKVALMGRRVEPLAEVARRVGADGGDGLVVPGDVRKYRDVAAAVKTTIDRFGGIDILVANAAVADSGPIAQADPSVYRAVVETNVLGVLHGIRAVLPHFTRRKQGHIVVVASVSGRVTYVGEPAYVASKHATIAFAECLRQEVAGHGIRVSVIEPGLVETPLIHVYAGALDMVPGVVPLDPTDIAQAVRFVLEQPPSVDIAELVIRPTTQVL